MEKLSEGEWRLMELLWEDAPVNSTQLVARCREKLQWSKSTTYTVLRRLCHKGAAAKLRRLCHKGAAANEEATVTPLVTREEVLKAQGEELSRQAGGVSPFLTAFFSGRRLTQNEAEELKQLIDQHTWEG